MNSKSQPVNPLRHIALALILGAGALPAGSQEETPASTDPNSSATKTEQATSTDRPEQDPFNETSPSDYQASEEISQDLSVSFPVDI